MPRLNFEEISTNIGDTINRARVPGGWFVLVTSEVVSTFPDGRRESGYEWRESIVFYPDPSHSWNGGSL